MSYIDTVNKFTGISGILCYFIDMLRYLETR